MILQEIAIPSFVGVGLSAIFSSTTLVVILGVFFVSYFIGSCFLMYHWVSYGMGSAGILLAEIVFVLVSIVLFVTAGLAISYF